MKRVSIQSDKPAFDPTDLTIRFESLREMSIMGELIKVGLAHKTAIANNTDCTANFVEDTLKDVQHMLKLTYDAGVR